MLQTTAFPSKPLVNRLPINVNDLLNPVSPLIFLVLLGGEKLYYPVYYCACHDQHSRYFYYSDLLG